MSGVSELSSLSGLAAFVVSVEAGGFAQAGRRLGMTPSAVGKGVARLEARLGVRLVQRTTRSIALTAEGALLYERAGRILGELRDAEDEIARNRGAPRGRVKVSLPSVIARRVVIPALPEFETTYPEVELLLDVDDRRVDLVAEGYDLVIRMGDLDDSQLESRRLCPQRFATCASPGYLHQRGIPRLPADLVDHRCIRIRLPSTGLLYDWRFESSSPVLGPGLALNDGEAVRAAALAGMGIVQLPRLYVAEDLNENRLLEVLVGQTADRGSIWLLRPPKRVEAPRTRVFADFVTGLLRGRPAPVAAKHRRVE